MARTLPQGTIRLLAGVSVAGMACFALSPAMAAGVSSGDVQAAPAAPTSDNAPAPSANLNTAAPKGLQDIVVTARKRTENLRDVPVAITAVSGAQLAQSNIVQLVDVVQKIPNFSIAYGSLSPYTVIRGFGSGANASFDQAVGKFVDDISFGRDQDGRIPIFDVERLEVLKGPQVLVFGNSTTAGALNVTTKKPGDQFEADGSVGYEFNNQEFLAQGGVTVPAGPDASFRIAGLYDDLARGWIYNIATHKHEITTRNWAVRPSARFTPTPDLTINLKVELDHLQDRGGLSQPFTQPTNPLLTFPEIRLNNVRDVSNDSAPFYNQDGTRMIAQLYEGDVNYKVLGGTLTLTTGYRNSHFTQNIDGDGSQLPIFNGFTNQWYKQFSQEARFSGSIGHIDYNIGGYYQHDNLKTLAFENFNLTPIGLVSPPFARISLLETQTNTYSGFADFTYHLTSKFSIEAGVRYANIDKTGSQASLPGNIIPDEHSTTSISEAMAAVNEAYLPIFSKLIGASHYFNGLKDQESHWEPQVVLQYKFAPKSQVYFKYIDGAKGGGFDLFYAGADPDTASFRAETAQSFEIGVKGLAFDNTLEFSLDAFRTTFSNLQVSIFDHVSSFVVSNVGAARSQGIELELDWAPIAGLKISGSGSYLDAKYLSFPGASCYTNEPATICVGGSQNLSGTPLPYASKWSGVLSVDYQHPLGSNGYELGEGVSVTGKTKYNASGYNDPLERQRAFAQIDAHLDFFKDGSWWRFSLFGKNLTNKQYIDFAYATIPNTNGEAAVISRGRQIGLRMGFKF